MSEENKIENQDIMKKIKWLGTEEIDVDKIDMSNLQARQDQINAGLEAFAEQIRAAGQIQSIVVYRKDDRFELLVGQRRFLAFQKVLNWDKIRADIIEEPENEQMKTTISWLENYARKKMSNKDTLRHVNRMLGERMTDKQVSETLGISQKLVNDAKGLPSCPEVVREACESGKISIENAIKATKARNFHKWDTDENEGPRVLKMAEELEKLEGQGSKVTKSQVSNICDYHVEHPDASDDELLKNKDTATEISLKINFSNSDSARIKSYQKKNDLGTPSDAVVDLVLEGLETHGE